MPMTPGLWAYTPEDRMVMSGDFTICELWDTDEGLEGDDPQADENGAAIAALPSLIAALRCAVESIKLNDQNEAIPGAVPWSVDWVKNAQAALAAACSHQRSRRQ